MTLTVDDLREHIETSLEDDALQRLLDAAEADIVRHAGEAGSVTEYVDGHGRFITTHHPIDSVSAITETYGSTTTTLAANDYLVRSACVVERLTTGDNARSRWYGRVAITYLPVDDEATRDAVTIDLVNLALSYQPGLTSETVGSWTQQYAQAARSMHDEWLAILSRLDVGPEMAVVG